MDKDFTKRIITDAVLLSVFIAFCYAVHIASQAGKFISFGIRDYASLISLDFSGVLVTVVSTAFYTVFALAIVFFSTRKVSILFKKYNAILAGVLSFFINLLMVFVYTTPIGVAVISSVYDTHKGLLISTAFYLATVVIGAIVLTIQSYLLSRTAKKDKDSIFPKFLSWLKNDKGLSKTTILTGSLVVCFMLLLPVYGYLNGYVGPRSSYHHEYSNIEEKQYVVIDRSSNRIVLAEIEDDKIMQKYLFIDRLEQGRISTEILNKPLSFGEVHTPPFLRITPWL